MATSLGTNAVVVQCNIKLIPFVIVYCMVCSFFTVTFAFFSYRSLYRKLHTHAFIRRETTILSLPRWLSRMLVRLVITRSRVQSPRGTGNIISCKLIMTIPAPPPPPHVNPSSPPPPPPPPPHTHTHLPLFQEHLSVSGERMCTSTS